MSDSEVTEPRAAWSGTGFSENFQNLVWNSPMVRAEVERGVFPSYTPYVETDWSTDTWAEEQALYSNWSKDTGVCNTCFLLRSASGECGC